MPEPSSEADAATWSDIAERWLGYAADIRRLSSRRHAVSPLLHGDDAIWADSESDSQANFQADNNHKASADDNADDKTNDNPASNAADHNSNHDEENDPQANYEEAAHVAEANLLHRNQYLA